MYKVISAALILSFCAISATAQAQESWYIKDGELVCLTKSAYDKQIKYLSQGIKEFVTGCGPSPGEHKVVMLDYNSRTASKVEIIGQDLVVWADPSAITSK